MKKIVLALIVLMFATPAWAEVTITAVQVPDTNEVIISFVNSDTGTNVRAFGLNIQLDNDANILEATGLSADYYIYPGTIQINATTGEVDDYGSIAAEYGDLPSDTLEGPPDGNGVTLECASLYAPPGFGSVNEPARFGDLASIKVSKPCTLCITANVSRAPIEGVVMEDPDEAVVVTYPSVCLDVDWDEGCESCRGDWSGDGNVDLNTDLLPLLGKLSAAKYFLGAYTYTEADTLIYPALAPWNDCVDWNDDGQVDLNTDLLPMLGKLSFAKYLLAAYTYPCCHATIDTCP